MEPHNLSSSSPLLSLPPSTLPPSTLPDSLPSSLAPFLSSSPWVLPTDLGATGATGEASGSCFPASSPTVSAFLAPILGMEFVLGLAGNSLALFIFCFHTRPWTSNTVFLVSLVVADFLLVVNLPLRVDYYLLRERWRFGAAVCKLNLFLLSTNRSASVVFLTAIALNRYLKVVRPHHALSRASVGAVARVAAGLWAGILLLNAHLLLAAYAGPSCLSYRLGTEASASLRWHQALFLLEFFLPLALILFAIVSIVLTIRRRSLSGQAGPQRAVRMLAVVVAVYTICFLPSVILGMASMVAFRLRACHALDLCAQLFHGSLAFTYLNFFLPLALILFAIVSIVLTIRRRSLSGQAGPQRAVRMLAVVVAVYTICFLPSVILGMASMVAFRLRACHALDLCAQLFHGSLAFTYLNSVLDPVLYCFSSPNFLLQVRALLGLTQDLQGPASDESSYQPSARRWEASRKAQAAEKLPAEGPLDGPLE
uniref:Oxoeicosanoid receptor 1 n=1 Tax=Ursus maritimus TaxID=29073 RepID=A0A452U6L7_URSMA